MPNINKNHKTIEIKNAINIKILDLKYTKIFENVSKSQNKLKAIITDAIAEIKTAPAAVSFAFFANKWYFGEHKSTIDSIAVFINSKDIIRQITPYTIHFCVILKS